MYDISSLRVNDPVENTNLSRDRHFLAQRLLQDLLNTKME